MKNKIEGFVEISNRTKQIISAACSEDDMYVHVQCGGSDAREATQKEINENLKYYKANGKCKFHIFIDTPTGCGWYSRDCLVCKQHIGLI